MFVRERIKVRVKHATLLRELQFAPLLYTVDATYVYGEGKTTLTTRVNRMALPEHIPHVIAMSVMKVVRARLKLWFIEQPRPEAVWNVETGISMEFVR